MATLSKQDPELWRMIRGEERREREGIELIPSENYASPAVREALGSVLTNKYSEGYPGKRYYGGQEWVDKIERLAQERVLKLFGVTAKQYRANVQPYSGSPANIAVYVALANFGDTLMGMDLTHGGHLTHGHKVNFSGRAYRFVSYGVQRGNHRLDYNEVLAIAKRERPRIIVSGATAYPRLIDFKKFQEIAEQVGAVHLADISHIAGLIVADAHPSPFPFTDVVTTTTHKTLRGPRGAVIFSKPGFADQIDRAVFPGLQGGPHENVIAAKAVCFKEASTAAFRAYGRQVVKNAARLAQLLLERGYTLVSGGTENHLLLVDLTNKGLSGREAQDLLDGVGLAVNKNTIPFETRSPFDPSGIRLGTPAATTRGMRDGEMDIIGAALSDVLEGKRAKAAIRAEIKALARKFPVPG